MDPLSVLASIIAVLQLTNKVIGYLNDVKDASKERARCAVETSNLYSLLTNLRFRLEDEDVENPWFVAIRALAVENGPFDQFKEALELLQDRMTSGRSHLAQFTEPLVWKFKKQEVDRILQSIERLKTMVAIALQNDHFKLSQAIKNDTGLIKTHMSTVEAGIESIHLDRDRTHLDNLRKWLSQTDFPNQQSDILRRRHQRTGQWFLDTPEFADWFNPSTPGATLLCTGIPGAGKTMLAAVAIDHLSAKVRSSTVALAFLYCSYKSRSEQSIDALLAAVLQQLVHPNCPNVVNMVSQLQEQHIAQGTRPSADQLRQTLLSALTEFSSVYIVIDALDECSADDGTRRQLLDHLRELHGATDLRVLITSRHLPDIVQEFSDTPRVEIRAHDEDVKLFLAGELHRLPRCIQRDAQLQQLVQDKIVGAIDGMHVLVFLLARLYVDSLMDKRTKSKIQSALESLSEGSHMLERAYEDAVRRLKSQLPGDSALAMRVLTYIVYAESALTTTELCHALAVESGTTSLDFDNLLDVQDIVSYFETVRADWGPHGQLDITRTCLTYLAFDVFRSGSCSTDAEFELRLEDYPFLDYAALHWGTHALSVQADVFDLACAVLLDDNLTSTMLQAAAAPLHRHTELGLHDFAERLFSTFPSKVSTWLVAKDNKGRTPLYVAAVHGQNSMLKLLLDRGADPNVHGGDLDYPLIAAVLAKHEEAATLLLKYGADPNLCSGEFGTALQTAFRERHRDLVRILIDAGAKIPAADTFKLSPLYMASSNGNKWSPIQVAAETGHIEIVKLLLQNGADKNSLDRTSLSPLHRAAFGGHLQVAKLLLDHGAFLNAPDLYGLTPFDDAANQGADIDTRDYDGRTPLYKACSRGELRLARFLLDKGADLIASSAGHTEIVEALIDHGADISIPNEAGWLPLNMAAEYGYVNEVRGFHEPFVSVLTRHQYHADIHHIDLHGRNLLHVATRHSQLDMFSYLLGLGVQLTWTDAMGDGLLRFAASSGLLQTCNLVLEQVALPAERRDYWSPLHWACRKGDVQVVERLVQAGVLAHVVTIASSADAWSPADIAVFHGHVDVVNKLVEIDDKTLGARANSRTRGEFHKSVLCDACDHSLAGTRYKCRTCPDFDYCFMCKPFLEHLHEGHEWNSTEPPSQDNEVDG
ncbi:ankyrin repeat-containing domain protein [Phaeosphaeria sp. MPI-PUGE-AT-0046c]|nr:ankyrin repeat-containing domain protein [Phaeosphaeria sp. MPI-PUGE-AT-0046c]